MAWILEQKARLSLIFQKALIEKNWLEELVDSTHKDKTLEYQAALPDERQISDEKIKKIYFKCVRACTDAHFAGALAIVEDNKALTLQEAMDALAPKCPLTLKRSVTNHNAPGNDDANIGSAGADEGDAEA